MRPKCYVLATLGTSPAVLTELLYQLVVGEQAEVVGLEVWTTGGGGEKTGEAKLSTFIRAGQWDELRPAVGAAHAGHLPWPDPATQLDLDQIVTRIAAGGRTFVVRAFQADDGPLSDVRSADDARRMDETLFGRVKTLTTTLPAGIALVGSLAGGRKTMSAGLQGAFSLLGRAGDRLVHVLLHAKLDELDPKTMGSYVAPTTEWERLTGVPVSEQLTLHDVQFPMLRALMLRASVDGYASMAELVDQDYGAFLRAMHESAGAVSTLARARLARHPKKVGWVYEVRVGDAVRATVTLSLHDGQILAALIDTSSGAGLETLVSWLAEHGVRPVAGIDTVHEDRNVVGKALSRLKAKLRPFLTQGLAAFAVESSVRGFYSVPAARDARIEIDLAELD